MADEPVLIVPYRDGPYLVRGPVVLRDQTGADIDPGRRVVALCRCGKSRVRPFCDGSHHLIHFRAPSEREDRVAVPAGSSGPGAGDQPGDARREDWALAAGLEHDAGAPDAELAALHDELLALRSRLTRLEGGRSEDARRRIADAARWIAAASASLPATEPDTLGDLEG